MIEVLTVPKPVFEALEIIRPKDRDGFALHAALPAIEAALSRAYANRRRLDRAVVWLEQLLCDRADQVAAGTWPPESCPCEFHQRYPIPRETT